MNAAVLRLGRRMRFLITGILELNEEKGMRGTGENATLRRCEQAVDSSESECDMRRSGGLEVQSQNSLLGPLAIF